MINSRDKGIRGELAWRNFMIAQGYDAVRSQQHAGHSKYGTADVICEDLRMFHFEVKNNKKLNVWDAMEQAKRDCGPGQLPVVCMTKNLFPFMVLQYADDWANQLRFTDTDGLTQFYLDKV